MSTAEENINQALRQTITKQLTLTKVKDKSEGCNAVMTVGYDNKHQWFTIRTHGENTGLIKAIFICVTLISLMTISAMTFGQ